MKAAVSKTCKLIPPAFMGGSVSGQDESNPAL